MWCKSKYLLYKSFVWNNNKHCNGGQWYAKSFMFYLPLYWFGTRILGAVMNFHIFQLFMIIGIWVLIMLWTKSRNTINFLMHALWKAPQ